MDAVAVGVWARLVAVGVALATTEVKDGVGVALATTGVEDVVGVLLG